MPFRIVFRLFAPFEQALRTQAAAFPAGELDVRPEAVEPQALYEELAAGADADLALVLTDWIPELVAEGRLLALDGFLAREPPDGWPDAWVPSMRGLQTVGGSTYGIAYHDGPMMLLYRTDLFESAEERAAFARSAGRELAPPRTWSEFLEVARFFHRPADGLDGTVVAAYPDGHNNVYDFLIQLASRGGELLLDGRAGFDSPAGRAALQFLRDLIHGEQSVVSTRALELDSVASGDYFASGAVAMMWNWCGFAAVGELPGSAIRGKIGFAPIPRGESPEGRHATLNIYWVMAIPAAAPDPDRSWRFLRHLASTEMDKVTSLVGGTGTRRSTWNDPEVQETFGYYALLEEAHRGAISPPQIREYPAINEVLSVLSRRVLHEGAEPEPALADAARKVDRILTSRGEAW